VHEVVSESRKRFLRQPLAGDGVEDVPAECHPAAGRLVLDKEEMNLALEAEELRGRRVRAEGRVQFLSSGPYFMEVSKGPVNYCKGPLYPTS
jgi:hypothetical protein